MPSLHLEYQHRGITFAAYIAYQETTTKKPLVLVNHAFQGRDQFSCDRADALAALGYVGCAIDLYGKGVLGHSIEESSALMRPLLEDRILLRERLRASIDAAKSHAMVDSSKMAAIGYCFGGLCVLDMARNFSDLCGVVSFHGLLTPPEYRDKLEKITAKVLVLHGYLDPLVPPPALDPFYQEMHEAQADWQLHCYGQAVHAFARVGANDPGFGTVYNPSAARRSWESMHAFLRECFLT
jgi:dienelactone hydrolase